jgi:hypothetical protein
MIVNRLATGRQSKRAIRWISSLLTDRCAARYLSDAIVRSRTDGEETMFRKGR